MTDAVSLDAPGLSLGDVSLSHPVEADKDGLRAAADDAATWAWYSYRADGAYFDTQFWPDYISRKDLPTNMHHVVRYKGEIVGSTCFLSVSPQHKRLEIGGTWYRADVRGTVVNPACKLLMIQRAFDWGARRVEWKTDSENARSRAAIEKLGATYDGVLRAHMVNHDGSERDTVYYSMLDDEWPEAKAALEARISQFR